MGSGGGVLLRDVDPVEADRSVAAVVLAGGDEEAEPAEQEAGVPLADVVGGADAAVVEAARVECAFVEIEAGAHGRSSSSSSMPSRTEIASWATIWTRSRTAASMFSSTLA